MPIENTTPAAEPALADRMYPGMTPAADAAPVSPPSPAAEPAVRHSRGEGTEAGADSTPAPGQMTEDEVLGEELSLADRMYGAGAAGNLPQEATGYEPSIREAFDQVWHEEGDALGDEERQALAKGRQDVSAALHELAVPLDDARAVSRELAAWRGREALDGDRLLAQRDTTEGELRAEWGERFDVRVKFAQQAAAQAMQRLPWLRDLLRSGAGNDPKLVRHFAKIGERQARRTRAKR